MLEQAARGLGEAAGILLMIIWGAAGVFVAWLLLTTFRRVIPIALLGAVGYGGVLLIKSNLESGDRLAGGVGYRRDGRKVIDWAHSRRAEAWGG